MAPTEHLSCFCLWITGWLIQKGSQICVWGWCGKFCDGSVIVESIWYPSEDSLSLTNVTCLQLNMHFLLKVMCLSCLCWSQACGGRFDKTYMLLAQSLACWNTKMAGNDRPCDITTILPYMVPLTSTREPCLWVITMFAPTGVGYTSVCSTMHWLIIMWLVIQLISTLHYNYNHYNILQLLLELLQIQNVNVYLSQWCRQGWECLSKGPTIHV